MNPLLLLAQAFFSDQAQLQTQNLKEAGMRAAETGRRVAIAGVFFAVSIAFVFSALIVAVIDIGLQIERSRTVGFSGLMVSALIFIAIALFSGICGWLSSRETKVVAPPPPPPETFKSELRPLLEAVAIGLLKEFLENLNRKHASAASTSEPEGQHR